MLFRERITVGLRYDSGIITQDQSPLEATVRSNTLNEVDPCYAVQDLLLRYDCAIQAQYMCEVAAFG